jgi:hypothetical protein
MQWLRMFRNRRGADGRVIQGEGCLAVDLVRQADANATAALSRAGDLYARFEQLENRQVEVENALGRVNLKLEQALGRLELMRTEQIAADRVRTAISHRLVKRAAKGGRR